MPGDDVVRSPDYILDCIDNISSKVSLLHYCHSHDLHVIASMGAGCKSDPTKIAVGDISLTAEDPLSKSTRRRLKMLGVGGGIPAVFSFEKPGPGKAQLLPLSEEEFAKGEVGELGVLPDFRVRILPVLGTMPAVFGYTIANHIICDISGYPNDYNAGGKGRHKMYDSLHGGLQATEERLAKRDLGLGQGEEQVGVRLPITKDDIAYLLEEVWRGKSIVSGLTTRLAFVRWRRPPRGFRPDPELMIGGQKAVRLELKDLVLMTKDEATRHEAEVLRAGKDPSEVYDATVIRAVEDRMKEEEIFSKFR
jgi:hypothetical protein